MGRLAPFSQAIAKPKKLDPEQSPWFWTPGKVGSRPAPAAFAAQLKEIDPEVEAWWNPVSERWQVWMKKPSLARTNGWMLLFIVKDAEGNYQPLDERVFHRLFSASAARWGNARRYFQHIERQMEREQEAREAANADFARTVARDQWDYSLIKVSQRGQSSGSKFSSYHSE